MASTTENKETQKGLMPDQRTWLARYLGSGVPWPLTVEQGGVEVDARELAQQLKDYDDAIAAGEEFEGLIGFDMEEARKSLAAIGFPCVVEKSDAYTSERGSKDEELKKLRDLLELQKEEIRKATDVTYKVKDGLFTKEKKSKIKKGEWSGLRRASEDSQAELEYSKEHYKDRTVSGPTPEQAKALNLVLQQLELLTEKLRKNEAVAFSPNELMEEIWTPLVREQIISEDQCPQEFSRVLALWKGASELYQERCKEKAREEQQAFGTVREILTDADELIGIGASVVDIVLSAVGTSAKSKEILELATKCARAGVQLVANALAKDFETCSTNIGDILAAAIPNPFGSLSEAAFLAAANAGFVAQKLSQRDHDGAFDLLCGAIENAFKAIGAGTDKDIFEQIGGHLSKSLKSAYGASKIASLLQQQPINSQAVLNEIAKITRNTTQQAVGEVLKKIHDKQKDDLKSKMSGQTEEERDEAVTSLEGDQETEAEDVDEKIDSIESLTDQLTSLLASKGVIIGEVDPSKIQEAALQAGADATNAQLEESQALYVKRMAIAFGVGVGADDEDTALLEDLHDIDKLIAQIEADKAQLALLNAVLDAVGGVVSMIVPQLGGVVKAKQFAMNVVAAIQRSQEIVKFTSLLSDARKATSPQAHVLVAEVDELERQLTSDVIEAGLNLGQAIALTTAAAAEMSGIGAAAMAAAEGVNAGLEALQSAKEFIDRKMQDRKVKRAWKEFRAALDNPNDRILIIKSFRNNPTLAKYAIAYGALEMGDPIAKETLRVCGLNDMVLAQEKTSADKVVKYLEAMYSDDIQVVGVVSVFVPDSGEPLAFASWARNKKAAETADGVTKWQPEPTNNIDSAFAAADKSKAVIAKLSIFEADDLKPWETHQANLTALAVACKSYSPKTTEGKPFEQFEKYLQELAFAATRDSQQTKNDIATAQSLRGMAVTKHKRSVEQVRIAVQAIHDAETALAGKTAAPTADDVITYCTSGGGKTLMMTLKKCAGETDVLNTQIGFVEQALNLTQKKMQQAKKIQGTKSQQATTMIEEALATLGDEFTSARAEMGKAKTSAEEALQQLGA